MANLLLFVKRNLLRWINNRLAKDRWGGNIFNSGMKAWHSDNCKYKLQEPLNSWICRLAHPHLSAHYNAKHLTHSYSSRYNPLCPDSSSYEPF